MKEVATCIGWYFVLAGMGIAYGAWECQRSVRAAFSRALS